MGLRTLLQKVVSVASLDQQNDKDNGEDEIAFVQALLEQGAQYKLLEQFFHPECVIVQETLSDDNTSCCPSSCETEGFKKNKTTLIKETSKLVESFPDFHYRFSVPRRSAAGVVIVDSCQGIGTHTGKPYSYGPYPPMDTKHVKVRCDPERFIFHVTPSGTSWHVVKLETFPLGRFCGPAGFYQKIGGILF